eukprot:1624296-Rhodomonas_salina.1
MLSRPGWRSPNRVATLGVEVPALPVQVCACHDRIREERPVPEYPVGAYFGTSQYPGIHTRALGSPPAPARTIVPGYHAQAGDENLVLDSNASY